jgi:hypothetical protein
MVSFFQLGDVLLQFAPHNVLATLLTGGRAPIFSEETAAEAYNPTQLGNRIPQVTFGYLKASQLTYTQTGYVEPQIKMSFWVYNKSNQPKALHIEVNQMWCTRVSTGGNFPCQYDPSAYPLVYVTDIVLAPGGAREIEFYMPTPPVAARPGVPQQVGDVQMVRVEVNVTDEAGNKAKLASSVRPQLPP